MKAVNETPSTAELTEGIGQNLSVVAGRILAPTDDPRHDAQRLVADCWRKLQLAPESPARLFVLWATPAYREYRPSVRESDAPVGENGIGEGTKLADADNVISDDYQIFVTAVHDELVRKLQESGQAVVPLIGCSAAACVMGTEVSQTAATLIAISSKYLGVRVATSADVRSTPDSSAERLSDELKLNIVPGVPRRNNQVLMLYLPGFETGTEAVPRDPRSYRAAEFVDTLRLKTHDLLYMFGGVASAGLRGTGCGRQFLNGHVFQYQAVAALMTTEVAFAVGLQEAIEPLPNGYEITQVDGEREIVSFGEGQPGELEKDWPQHYSLVGKSGDQNCIFVPQFIGGRLFLQRDLKDVRHVQLAQAKKWKLADSVIPLLNWCIDDKDLQPSHFRGVLDIICTSRLATREQLGDTQEQAVADFIRGATRVGCFLDGELGVDQHGTPIFTNWSVSRLLLADKISLPRLDIFNELAGVPTTSDGRRAATDDGHSRLTPRKALEKAVEKFHKAKFPGAMISLIEKNDQDKYIVALAATAGPWRNRILPETIRKADSDDVLARVFSSQQPIYVHNIDDKERYPFVEHQLAREARITSFYAVPLSIEGQVIGILQIDLGDTRDLPELPKEFEEALKSLAVTISIWVGHVMGAAILAVSDAIDEVIVKCRQCDSFSEVVDTFLGSLCEMLSRISAPDGSPNITTHLRVFDERSGELRLAGGVGPFFDTAKTSRVSIKVDDRTSPNAKAFREQRMIVVNDSTKSGTSREHREILQKTTLRPVLDRILSHVSIAIEASHDAADRTSQGRPLGVLDVSSNQPWFFQRHIIKGLNDVARRLPILLERAQVNDEMRLFSAAQVLPVSGRGLHAESIEEIQRQLDSVRKSAKADLLACYLWDEDRERYVLRLPLGWRTQSKWDGSAWYAQTDWPMSRIHENSPPVTLYHECSYDPDSESRSAPAPPEKYVREMFGGGPVRYERIVLPLRFRDERLGAIFLYRRFRADEPAYRSGFQTTRPTALEHFSRILSSAIAAVMKYEAVEWARHEAELLSLVNSELMGLSKRDTVELCQSACELLMEKYPLRRCRVFLNQNRANPSEATVLKLIADRRIAAPHDQVRKPVRNVQEHSPKSLSHNAELAWKAFHDNQVTERRRKERPHDQVNATRVWLEKGVVENYLPMTFHQQQVGLAILTWDSSRVSSIHLASSDDGGKQGDDGKMLIEHHHSLEHLRALGRHLAAAVRRYELEQHRNEVVEASSAMQARLGMEAYLTAKLHRLANSIQRVEGALELINDNCTTPDDKQTLFAKALFTTGELREEISKSVDIGRRLLATNDQSAYEPWGLVDECVKRAQAEFCRATVDAKATSERVKTLRLFGHVEQIRECIHNLICNAARVSGAVQVEVSLDDARQECVIAVHDNGPGVSERDFREFVDGRMVGRSERGSGMGLFLSRIFALTHKGSLEWVKPRDGVGTTVELRLPAKEES